MRILFLHKQVLFPHDTGGKIRALNVLRHLARWHHVTYLCNLRPGEEPALPLMRALGLDVVTVPSSEPPAGSLRFYRDVAAALFQRHPFTITRNYSPALHARAHQLVRESHYDLAVCDTIFMARHVTDLGVPARILFEHNVETKIYRRHADPVHGRLRSAYMRIQARRMARFESDTGKQFDAVIAVSPDDQSTFERDFGWTHVHSIDTAVDLDYFRPRAGASPSPAPTGDTERIVFVGSMDWLPNQDGVRYFVQHVWPEIRRHRPNAKFQVVGRKPPASIRALAAPDVEIVGAVDDVRPYLAAARAVVVPLLVGGGTRLKIYEALAMRRPLVSTSIGAEGLPLLPREHVLLADTPQAFADAVLDLLEHPHAADAMAARAESFVRARFGSEPVARQFERICLDTIAARRERRTIPSAPAPLAAQTS